MTVLISLTRRARFLCLAVLALSGMASAQPPPAVRSAVADLVQVYLDKGPERSEINDGAALGSWALLEKVALPELLEQPALKKGNWPQVWLPIRLLLDEAGAREVRPLEAIAMWEETRSSPARFVRLLGKRGLVDPKEPEERKKAMALREAIGTAASRLPLLRSSVRFEKAGWKYTGTVSVTPGQRIVRVALRGSQPCELSGRVRSVNLSLKGRLFDDPSSPDGFKIQLLDDTFVSHGCELAFTSALNLSSVQLATGDDARLVGSLSMDVTDQVVSGRLQMDIVSRPPGKALKTGRAVYKVRGQISRQGVLTGRLIPISTSGAKEFRQLLNSNGQLSGTLSQNQATGKIELDLFRDAVVWRARSGEPQK